MERMAPKIFNFDTDSKIAPLIVILLLREDGGVPFLLTEFGGT